MMNSKNSTRMAYYSPKDKKRHMQRSKWFPLLVFFFFLIVVVSQLLMLLNSSQLDDKNHNVVLHGKVKSAQDFSLSSQIKYRHLESNKLREVVQCSNDQMIAISTQLEFDTCDFTGVCGRIFKACCGIIAETSCPKSSWLEDYYREDFKFRDDSNVFTGLSIGCNKGFDAIDTARMGMNSPKFDKMVYADALEKETGKTDAGVCNQMKDLQFELLPNEPLRSGEMHCIEPMPSTSNALESVVNNIRLNEGVDQFHISKAAISSSNGIVKFPSARSSRGRPGVEVMGIDSCNKDPESCDDVPMFSLQTYVNKFVKSTGPINILSIDVEGFDFDVLFGAGDVLDRTEYIEFEYHRVGNWFNYHIMDAVRLLDGKGFTCYWAGKEKLWRITECYHDYYNEFKGWSNVVCAHRSQRKLATKMENLFLKTVNTAEFQ